MMRGILSSNDTDSVITKTNYIIASCSSFLVMFVCMTTIYCLHRRRQNQEKLARLEVPLQGLADIVFASK